MRKKEKRLVITFHTTSDAMAMESFCKQKGAAGRMIPVPRELSAGCGMSWCAPLDERENMIEIMKTAGIKEEALNECEVFV